MVFGIHRRRLRILKNILKRPRVIVPLLQQKLFMGMMQNKTHSNFSPLALDIEPTAKCNFACKYCQVSWWDRSAKVKNLTLEQFRKIVDQFPNLLQIKLQGMGEPLLNSEFFDMVAYATTKGIIVRTTSNGSLLNEKMIEKALASGLGEITISMDGATKETFERIRKNGKFDMVVQNIRNLIQKRGKAKDPVVSVWMVGTKDNIQEFPKLVQLCKSLGVDMLYLQHHLNFWGDSAVMQQLETLSINREQTKTGYTKEVDTILAEAQRVAKKVRQPLTIYKGNTLQQDEKCIWPWSSAYISADGYVVPCCIIANPAVKNFGNLQTQSFKDIWNSKGYQQFRQTFIDGKPLDICAGCYVGCKKKSAASVLG